MSPAETKPAVATNAQAMEVVLKLQAQRNATVEELSRLSDDECRLPATWANSTRSVQFLLRAFAFHEMDHLQHLQRLLRARGVQLSQAQLLLAKVQALRGELESMLLSLTDEQFDAVGPVEGDWSARQVVSHLSETDARYAAEIARVLAENRATAT